MRNKDNQTEDVHSKYFSRETEKVFTLIGKTLAKYKYLTCDLNDLYYFGCVFIGVLATRFNNLKKAKFSLGLFEMLQEAANDGITMCNGILTAKLVTQDDRDKAMQDLITNLKGEGNVESNALIYLSQHLDSMNMKTDSLWKATSNLKYPIELENEIVSQFENLIDDTMGIMPLSNLKAETNPELVFLVTAIINVGLMIGYTSVLYKQSLDEAIDLGVKKINAIMQIQPKENVHIH
ncbi:MAG: hypothetical protein ACYCQI_10290 [Gammaproteobacteria bacterium]